MLKIRLRKCQKFQNHWKLRNQSAVSLLHMDEATEDDNFEAIAQRAEELDEDIAERKALVEEMNKEETLETELKEEA